MSRAEMIAFCQRSAHLSAGDKGQVMNMDEIIGFLNAHRETACLLYTSPSPRDRG